VLRFSEEANRSKDDFLAILSHELRTPLNAVLGWVRLLEGGELTADRGRHALEVISRNATLQARLIEDILDLSRIIAGKLEIERRPLLVPPLVETAISGVLPAAEGRGLQLVRVISRDLPPIEADAKRLPEDRAMALAAGYGGYCVKPVDPRQLLREVESVLRAV
jgi:signal transduction histidine kinase